MKIFPSLFFISILILAACQNSPEKQSKKTELRDRITFYEDSLATLQKDPKKAAQITSLAQIELINRLKAYSRAFPKDTFSADCLFDALNEQRAAGVHRAARFCRAQAQCVRQVAPRLRPRCGAEVSARLDHQTLQGANRVSWPCISPVPTLRCQDGA